MVGWQLIDKIALLAERIAKTMELQIILKKKCRKPKQQIKPKRRVNNVDDTTSEAATVGTSASVGEQVNHIDRLLQKRSIYDAIFDFDCDDFDDNCFAANST